jgi:hypothetical protein
MTVSILENATRPAQAAFLFLLLLVPGIMLAQAPLPAPAGQALTPNQLNDLVAPIALYPDPLLSQILVAASYPLEVVQAYQWSQMNPGRRGRR